MKDTKRENGITLIALTITIIVLIILASISTHAGITSIQSSKLTKFKQELEIMQAQVDLLYEKCKNTDGTINMDKVNAIGKDLTNLDSAEINEIFSSLNIDNTEDYRYYDTETIESLDISGVENEFLVSIKDRDVISIEGFESDGIMYRSLYQFPDKERISGDITRGDVTFSATAEKSNDGWNINITDIKFSKYVGKGIIKYKESNDSDWTTIEENAKQDDYTFKVTTEGKYIIQITDAAGISAEQEIEIEVAHKGERYDDDTTITIGDDEVSIPGGSTVSEIPGEYEDVDDGIVIYIIPKDETPDWEADEDGDGILDVQEKYDQFVWVPVPNAVLDLSSTFNTLDEDDIKAKVQEQINANKYPMAIKTNKTDYIGVLYQFIEEDGKVKIEPLTNDVNGFSWTPLSTSGNREPAYLEDSSYSDGSTYNDTNPKITQNLLQQEFNTMVNKVSGQKGFWVGRYETSNMKSSNTNDLTNKINIIRGTTNGINSVNWYRMYAQQKTYRSLTEISSNRTSGMIWGSQWDQIMIWMKKVENKSKNSYYIVNSLGMGNFGTSDDSDLSTSYPAVTGNSDNYKVKNVFDLAGNIRELTLEAININVRVFRRRGLLQYLCL